MVLPITSLALDSAIRFSQSSYESSSSSPATVEVSPIWVMFLARQELKTSLFKVVLIVNVLLRDLLNEFELHSLLA